MNTCKNCGKIVGTHCSILEGCMCQYSMQNFNAPLTPTDVTKLNETALRPKRPWVVLTDTELESMAEQYVTDCYFDTLKYGQAIQSKLKDKNDG